MLFKARRLGIVFANLLLIASSLTLAWLLRFEFSLPHRQVLWQALPLLLVLRLATLARFKLLHGYWSYADVRDVEEVFKAVAVGSAAFFLAERYILAVRAFPLTIYCIEPVLTMALLCGARLCPQLLRHAHESARARREQGRFWWWARSRRGHASSRTVPQRLSGSGHGR